MAPNRVVRQLELVALADEDAEGALAVTRSGRRLREAAAQEGEGSLELLAVVALADGCGDQLGLDPERAQTALEPLGAPAVQLPPILREAPGEAGVVEVALLTELPDYRLDDRWLGALAGQEASDLGDRVIAAVEGTPRDVTAVLEAHLGIERPLRGETIPGSRPGMVGRHAGADERLVGRDAGHDAGYATAISGTGGASASRSIGCTRS